MEIEIQKNQVTYPNAAQVSNGEDLQSMLADSKAPPLNHMNYIAVYTNISHIVS